EDHEVDAGFRAGSGERLHLPCAEKRRRIRFLPLLEHAKNDVGAGGLREAGELFERALGVEPPRSSGDQPDERCAFATGYVARTPCMSSHRIAPARTSRGSAAVTSTIVDGAPPGVRPVSISRSTRSPSVRSTTSGSSVAGSPLTLALVAVMGRPAAA